MLSALDIPWVLICDGAAFDVQKRQKRKLHIFEQVLNGGTEAEQLRTFLAAFETERRKREMDKTLFNDEKQLGKQYGVFTLALGWTLEDKKVEAENDESFEAFVESIASGKLAEAEDEVGDSKVRKGRWIAQKVACPPAVSDLYTEVIAALANRGLHG